VVLTKLDGDARGGAALSVAQVTGRQVMFASNGEKLEDFDTFHPDRMASRILGMGDVLTLIEQAEKAFDADQAAKMAEKLQGGGRDFTLDDFLQQMESVRRMGSLSKLLGLLPGMGEIRDQLSSVDDRDLDRVAAMIRSMTPAERDDPKIINGSRRARIARGSGATVTEVNNLVERFFEARKVMQSMASGGLPGLPGMPGMPGMPGQGRGKKARGKAGKGGKARVKGGRSGNPARRALEQQAAEARRAAGGTTGGTTGGAPQLPPDFELPPEFRDLLPPGQN
jgi:signal recognition particle subunit SRP54